MSKKETFRDLVYKTLMAGTENVPTILGVSPHRVTKVLEGGKHTELTAEELIGWSKLLKVDHITLIRDYGCGYESLTPKDLNKIYTHFGYSFELPEPIPHAA